MGQIVNGNPLNKDMEGKTKVKSTTFNLSGHKFGTYRFGEYGISFVYNGYAGDKVKVRSNSEVDSYTMGAPLKMPIYMNKTYIQVPRMAILPKAWEKIYKNPAIGQDIDATLYGTSVPAANMNSILSDLITKLKAIKDKSTADENKQAFRDLFHLLTLAEAIYSNGSLTNALEAHLAEKFNYNFQGSDRTEIASFDAYYEKIWNIIKTSLGAIAIKWLSETTYQLVSLNNQISIENPGGFKIITEAEFLMKLRDGDIIDEVGGFRNVSGTSITGDSTTINTVLAQIYSESTKCTIDGFSRPFDLARIWAYQLSCAEWFTNDKVDYIYDAEIYRNYIGDLIATADAIRYQSINGIDYQVDFLSGYYFYTIWNAQGLLPLAQGSYEAYEYYMSLFKYNRSLRFKDYFTGARTRPLAIGQTTIPVQSGTSVDVVDVSKNIQMQRFLNVVNKIPQSLNGYTKGIMGESVAPDWHYPQFLGNTTEAIYGAEVENTGVAQMTEKVSRTTTLKNQASRYRFEFKLDRDSIIIGFISFDIERSYCRGINRTFMHVDRFDFFNPYLQYTGDQPIYKEELYASKSGTFAYTGAYMENKQRVNDAFGGFVTALPGWIFNDLYEKDGKRMNARENDNLGPDFVRSKPSELDNYYISLAGNSLANHFHFIIDTYNEVSANRKMAYNPQILG